MLPTSRGLIATAFISLALIALFVAAGIFTHRYAERAAQASELIFRARTLSADTLKNQLDEETGIRGLAATGDRALLEPYSKAVEPLAADFRSLTAALSDVHASDALPALADAQTTNATWVRRVAEPTLADPRGGAQRVQRFGKRLIDRFRADMRGIDARLDGRAAFVSDELQGAVDRIMVLVIAAALVLSVAAVAYAVQQLRAGRRIAAQELLAQAERRRRAEVQAAYEAEKRIADRLQTAFSQRPLPALETLRFSASYVPATEETRLGGDWYDVIALPGNRVLFTIGDVTGHGIEAAVTMNRARQSFVTGALLDADPGSVLDRVNREMAAHEDRLVTAIAGVADAAAFEFCYAVAGHPPPVLLEPGRTPRFLDCGSLPLGGFLDAQYASKRVQTVPGATLILYTDGAVEHSHNVIEGEEELLKAIAGTAEHPEVDPATWIHQTIFAGRPVGDDVAILTIGFRTDPALGIVVTADNARRAFSGRVGGSRGEPGRLEAKRLARRMHPRGLERYAS